MNVSQIEMIEAAYALGFSLPRAPEKKEWRLWDPIWMENPEVNFMVVQTPIFV